MRGSFRSVRALAVATAGALTAAALSTTTPAWADSSPQAVPDEATVDAASHTAVAHVLDNDQIGDPAQTKIVDVTSPARGRAEISGDTIVYTPDACAPGDFVVEYTIEAAGAPPSTATVTFHVPDEAVPIQANADEVRIESGAASGDLLANDCGATTPIHADTVLVTVLTGPDHGEVTVHDDGTFVYVAAADSTGPDSFTYRLALRSNPSSESQAVVTLVPDAGVDLAVALSGLDDLDLGKPATLTATVVSLGGAAPEEPAALTVTAPRFVTIGKAPDGCGIAGQTARCDLRLEELQPGAAVDLDFTIELDESAPVGTVIHAITATVTVGGDADLTNNTASTGDLGQIVEGGITPPPGSTASPRPRGSDRRLAETGVTYVGEMTAAGALLVLLGVGAVVFSRRRHIAD